jgi:hypothetical protein
MKFFRREEVGCLDTEVRGCRFEAGEEHGGGQKKEDADGRCRLVLAHRCSVPKLCLPSCDFSLVVVTKT